MAAATTILLGPRLVLILCLSIPLVIPVSVAFSQQCGCENSKEEETLKQAGQTLIKAEKIASSSQDKLQIGQLRDSHHALTERLRTLESRCRDLEMVCRQLDSEATSLNSEEQSFVNDDQILTQEVDSFNEQCSGELPEPQYSRCISWRNTLASKESSHNGRVSNYNQRLNDFQRSEKEEASNNTLHNQNVEIWEHDVQKFAGTVKELAENLKASRSLAMPQAAANLVTAMNKVAERLNLPKGGSHEQMSKNCSVFFRGLGEQLAVAGRGAGKEWTAHLQANDIISSIESNSSSQWELVEDGDNRQVGKRVQELANRGAIVIGVAKDLPNGHIAVAFPIPPELQSSKFPGSGPFVKDGNEHFLKSEQRLYASSWGAVKASKAFDYNKNPPRWYIWTPSE